MKILDSIRRTQPTFARPATRAFDYVVVGAGTAGCVVACRLAATGASVALLEAGGPYHRLLDVPMLLLWTWLRRPERYCWQNQTEPQAGLDGRRVFWPAGRLVGGSSAINAMIYYRGHRASYDRWQHLIGDRPGTPAWNYDALLPYSRRSEDFEGDESVHHGTGGPIGKGRRDRTINSRPEPRGRGTPWFWRLHSWMPPPGSCRRAE